MEILYDDIIKERVILRNDTQTLVEGDIPLPDDRRNANILSTRASAAIGNVMLLENKVVYEGTVTFDFICADMNGEAFSFKSEADFKHTALCEGGKLLPDMSVKAESEAIVSDVNVFARDGFVSVSANVFISSILMDKKPLKMVCGIDGEELFLSKNKLDTSLVELADEQTVKLQEMINREIDINTVVFSDGRAFIRGIQPQIGGAVIEGTLRVECMYLDSENKLCAFSESIPFSEEMELDETLTNIDIRADVLSINVKSMGGEYTKSTAKVEAIVNMKFYKETKSELDAVNDCYSISSNVAPVTSDESIRVFYAIPEYRISMRETLTMGEEDSGIYSLIGIISTPTVQESIADGTHISISGIIHSDVIYLDEGGKLCSFSDDVPFSHEINLPQQQESVVYDVLASAYATSDISGNGMRSVDVSYTLYITSKVIGSIGESVVIGIDEDSTNKNDDFSGNKGIVIYFTGDNETGFDIAKRFNMRVEDANPEKIRNGKLVMFMGKTPSD